MGNLDKDTHGECYIKIKAKFELVLPQAKELQGLPVNPPKLEEAWNRFSFMEQILFPQKETNLLTP